jgi:hypothetical protein
MSVVTTSILIVGAVLLIALAVIYFGLVRRSPSEKATKTFCGIASTVAASRSKMAATLVVIVIRTLVRLLAPPFGLFLKDLLKFQSPDHCYSPLFPLLYLGSEASTVAGAAAAAAWLR